MTAVILAARWMWYCPSCGFGGADMTDEETAKAESHAHDERMHPLSVATEQATDTLPEVRTTNKETP